jgi:hypothetical protein
MPTSARPSCRLEVTGNIERGPAGMGWPLGSPPGAGGDRPGLDQSGRAGSGGGGCRRMMLARAAGAGVGCRPDITPRVGIVRKGVYYE